jgi:hypothetical protein
MSDERTEADIVVGVVMDIGSNEEYFNYLRLFRKINQKLQKKLAYRGAFDFLPACPLF